jgi:hypothetical protein
MLNETKGALDILGVSGVSNGADVVAPCKAASKRYKSLPLLSKKE